MASLRDEIPNPTDEVRPAAYLLFPVARKLVVSK